MIEHQTKIAVIGLGYVGLPLALAFAEHFQTLGFDVSEQRIEELQKGVDRTGEVDSNSLLTSKLRTTNNENDLSACNFFIVTVPTPIDSSYKPDLRPLLNASELVGKYLNANDTVVYESTVYPGVTEDVCIPVLEKASKLKGKIDFSVGYSPERINPGDKVNTVKTIMKLVAGDSRESSKRIKAVYDKIIDAGTFEAASIKVAECCKCLENTQRDLNIALMNNISEICRKIGISTHDVISAAKTKWNFLPFEPGLVGGHCIGVDPYYLIHLGENLDVDVNLMKSARDVNENIIHQINDEVVATFGSEPIEILICGFTFKENCPDVRNTKVSDLIRVLQFHKHNVQVYDPVADSPNVIKSYEDLCTKYDLIIFAVKHDCFANEFPEIAKLLAPGGKIFDLKRMFAAELSDWSL